MVSEALPGPAGPGRPRRRFLAGAAGTHSGSYTTTDWGLVAAVALMWGSANLFIAVALDDIEPGLVTWLRVSLGALTLWCVPSARRPVARHDWSRVTLVAITWVAFPFTLFPVAQQWIDSSLAGMLIGALPLFAAALAAVLLRSLPGPVHLTGLLVGFGGVVAVGWPALGDTGSTAVGAALVIIAVLSYSVAVNVSVPLVQHYGSGPVMARALAVSAVLTAPFGLWGLPDSSPTATSLGATVVLGVGASGLAFLAFTALSSRVGASRAAATNYFVPVVALVAGVTVRAETVAAVSVAGVALVLLGAWLVSR